jgi:GT2 family glycosyltransferase
MNAADITVVIVAWNQVEKTLDCLVTVAALDTPPGRVLLVDNGSAPPLAAAVGRRFPAVELLRLPDNRGFAGGYNAGITRALDGGAAAVLLLNNDTLVAPDALDQLAAEMETAQDVGLVTAKITYAAEPQRIWTVGANLNVFLDLKDSGQGQLDTGQWGEPRDVAFAPFCAILVRREVFETVGLLDEAFFLYYEDMDYCRRARRAGWRVRLCPAALVRHDVSASSGGRDSPLERYWMAQSSGRYFRKHGRGLRLLLIVPFRLASALKTSLRLLLAGRRDALRAYWLGLWIGWRTGRATTPPPAWLRAASEAQR